jgi:hypothetical protein
MRTDRRPPPQGVVASTVISMFITAGAVPSGAAPPAALANPPIAGPVAGRSRHLSSGESRVTEGPGPFPYPPLRVNRWHLRSRLLVSLEKVFPRDRTLTASRTIAMCSRSRTIWKPRASTPPQRPAALPRRTAERPLSRTFAEEGLRNGSERAGRPPGHRPVIGSTSSRVRSSMRSSTRQRVCDGRPVVTMNDAVGHAGATNDEGISAAGPVSGSSRTGPPSPAAPRGGCRAGAVPCRRGS